MKDRWIVTLLVVASGFAGGCVSSGGVDTERGVGDVFADPRSNTFLLNGQITGHFVDGSNELGNGPEGWPLFSSPPIDRARELHLGPCHFEVVDWDGTKVTGHHAMVEYAGAHAGVFYVDVPNAAGDDTRHLYGYTLISRDALTLVPIDYRMDHFSVLRRADDDPPARQEDYWCLPVSCCDGTLSPSCTYGGSLTGCCSYHGGVCGPSVQ